MASTCRGVLRLAFFSTLAHAVLSFVAITSSIRIDCGSTTPILDTATNSSWGIDQYYAGGSAYTIPAAPAVGLSTTPEVATLRAFPKGSDPCYHIPVPNGRFLVRLTWAYSNYDGLNAPPIIGVLFGPTQTDYVDFNTVVNATDPVVLRDYLVYANTTLQICFYGEQGLPFINSIEVNPLHIDAYEASYWGTNVSLNLAVRLNGGGPAITGYPTDPGYRSWSPDFSSAEVPYNPLSTTQAIASCGPTAAPDFLPCQMFQTAREASLAAENITLFTVAVNPISDSNQWLLHLYFAEINANVKPGERTFYVILGGYGSSTRIREDMDTGFDAAQNGLFNATTIAIPFHFPPSYIQDLLEFRLVKANGSLYNPILNGFELYEVIGDSLANASVVEAELIAGTYTWHPAMARGGLSTGAVVGVVFASIGGLLLLALLLFLLCRCCRRRSGGGGGSGTRGGGFGVLRSRSFGRSQGGEEGEAVGPYQQGFQDSSVQMSGR